MHSMGTLTCNLWSLLSAIFIIREFHYNLVGFGFGFAMIVFGMAGFSLSGDPYESKHEDEAEIASSAKLTVEPSTGDEKSVPMLPSIFEVSVRRTFSISE